MTPRRDAILREMGLSPLWRGAVQQSDDVSQCPPSRAPMVEETDAAADACTRCCGEAWARQIAAGWAPAAILNRR